MIMIDWNDKVKRLLKSELIKRAVSNADLAQLLSESGVEETKASIDSKISRGTFSAAFLIQCLNAIGCKNFVPEVTSDLISEPIIIYRTKKNKHQDAGSQVY